MNSVITATGSYLPEKILTNDDVSKMVDTNDAWIRERTGITQRHIIASGESTSHLATRAAQAALKSIGYSAEQIDGIVIATSTPDRTMPSTAAKVQAALGISKGAAVDVAAACTGFVYALSVAHGWIQTGIATKILVIGAETMSSILDWNDRSTCILFGDGAGAVILEARDDDASLGSLRCDATLNTNASLGSLRCDANNKTSRGIRAITLEAQGELGPLLGTNGGVSSTQTAGTLFMQGQEVFRHGVEKMSAITVSTVAKAGLTMEDIRWVIPHQANARMITMIARTLKLPADKCVITVDRHANTSAASIPLALDVANRDGRLKKHEIIALPALGAGLTWGCAVISW